MARITLHLNGRPAELEGRERASLLEALRAAGLSGAKEGCGEGECGACTVVVRDARGYRAVNSCLVPLAAVAGGEVWTVEGLGEPGSGAHPVQQAVVAEGAVQCGYCTPGVVMSLFAGYYAGDPLGTVEGNLCRCTGYRPIRDAARHLGDPAPGDPFLRRLSLPPPQPGPWYGQQFMRPTGLAEALALLAEPGSRPVAGATDLALAADPGPRWVSLEAVPELRGLAREPQAVVIGAALPLADLGAMLGEGWPFLRPWLAVFASPAIRNRATLGGNLATASPIGDSAPLLLVLDAVLRLRRAGGERTVPLPAFFRDYRRTVLEPGEIIAAVAVPLPLPQEVRFYKVAKRPRDDISTVAAAFALSRDAGGRVQTVRMAFGGVAATPVRATAAEAVLQGRAWTPAAVAEARAVLGRSFRPLSDLRGSSAYRQALVVNLWDRFVEEVQGP
ncbi:Xanthine dehydrogenase, iron-sulfur cluster and FAD-binding subunit A [Candidatus Hydrogenisulfobacillus filiaventi]|uniref:Xanthine dehydrogenase, iron-sulfur cluster and FAD-binding subunit A n=1 Tax=Candidatus Hydrogenisulfobacillus filiaventi TaxID=2707344 RepID=A0A6F8ZDU5_9FIRM|nr:FAD binding domain-containing protein [Bacillota bacterium]CAB1127925.1 Xanthine dehydrogenase, iron-sulfur cluster and FAD-binding subunit A [Candidatus Hydrogenisulfobacillus filiaventi]